VGLTKTCFALNSGISVLHDQILTSLRNKVRQLEENELFEQMLLRGSQAALELQPSTTDIDVLMQSMMVTPQSNTVGQSSHRPVNVTVNGNESRYERGTEETMGTKAGKRSRNGSSRNLVA